MALDIHKGNTFMWISNNWTEEIAVVVLLRPRILFILAEIKT